jgi:hypothetical protein
MEVQLFCETISKMKLIYRLILVMYYTFYVPVVYSEPFNILDTYTLQMDNFIKNVQSKKMPVNNIEEGIETLKLVLNG